MNFSCDRCHKRFTTSDQPVPGRTYRIPCACGNTIVLEIADPAAEALHQWSADRPYTTPPGMYRLAGPREPDPFAATDGAAARHDPLTDPTAPVAESRGVAASIRDVTPTFVGPLARRDASATLDESSESSEYRLTGAVSFDDVLRRTRRQGFLAGVAAGAGAGAVAAVALIVAMARFSDGGPPPEAPAPAARAPDAAPPLHSPSPSPLPPSFPPPSSAPPSPPRSGGEGRGEGAERPTVPTRSRAKAPAPEPEPEKVLPTETEETPAADSYASRKPAASRDREASDPADGAPEPDQEPARTALPVQPLEVRDGDPAPPTEER